MATGTQPRSRVFESRTALSGRVDRERGVIAGVKVLGVTSSNGRRYLPEAIRQAAHMYEGASVRIDHPSDPDDQRSSDSVLGWLRDVRVGNDGSLYADLHYLKEHPFANRLVEAAERNPRIMGLSHNASGSTEVDRDGTLVVHEITEVRSVDLVADPATTRGLFESVQTPKKPTTGTPMKLREWFDRTKLLPPARKAIAKLFESDYMDADGDMALDAAPVADAEPETAAPVAEDPADMAPEEALRMGFRVAIMAVVDDNTLPVKDKLGRLKKLMMAADELINAGEEIPEEKAAEPDGDEAPAMEGEEAGEKKKGEETLEECDEEGDKKKPASMKESKDVRELKAKLARYEQLESARDLCESLGYQPDGLILEALVPLDEAKRKALIERQKASLAQSGTGKPRTATPLPEGRREKIAATATGTDGATATNGGGDLKDWVKSIKRG